MKNPTAKALVDILIDSAAEFTERKKGQQWRALLFTLADVFREDRVEIQRVMIPETKAKKRGQAKIIRPKVGRTSSPYGGPGGIRNTGCKDCPDNEPNYPTTIDGRRVRPARIIGSGARKEVQQRADLPFASVEQILERFENDASLLKAYAQAKEINVGRASKPETLAAKIFDAQMEEE